jgi:alpha-mannosidase
MEEEQPTTPSPAEVAPPTGRPFYSLIPLDGQEPPADLSDRDALAIWAAVTAPWHPALLARADGLPRVEPVESPSTAEPGDVRIVALGAEERLPSGYRTGAEDFGAAVIDGETDRMTLARRILDRIEPGGSLGDESDPLVLDFFALGTARWMLRDLTTAMGHLDCLDTASLARETLAGARAWQSGDRTAAQSRLRAAFELLTQARERFYPVDAYLVDLCLLDPATPADDLAGPLEARAPFTLLAPARAVEALAERAPSRVAALREAITEGWADVAGGAYAEADEPFLPVESILWQLRKGGEVYRQHLDDRNVETLARRRFGLYPQLPQIARRFGLRFGLHLGFDAGGFPLPAESKRLWEAPDGSQLEALTRAPLAADRPAQGLHLPWKLARSMKDDHVATLPFVHWPSPVAPWYVDLRRVAAYSPVLARWVTMGDYFHLTDRPFETFRTDLDAYRTPYLAQAAARHDPAPISRRAEHARLRARLDAMTWMHAVATALSGPPPDQSGTSECTAPPPEAELRRLEDLVETGPPDEARAGLDRFEPIRASALAWGVVGTGRDGRPGYLVFNPVGVARRATVLLPDAAPDLRPEGPLRAAQLTEEGVRAVVDLPAFGYAWVPKVPSADALASPARTEERTLSVKGHVLRNGLLHVEVDQATGGLRAVQAEGEATARLGQQLVMTGLTGPDGRPASSRMRAEGFEVDYGGPALVQAVSRGVLLDPVADRPLARFRQRLRLWAGRNLLELEIELSDLDAGWLAHAAGSDPWAHFLSCRWAWPDASTMLRRTSLLAAEVTEADRPETPDALDLSTRRQRTALLFGGLAHHRRHGPRMLDTLLVAGRESARRFHLGVALDLEHPYHAALDLTGPAPVVATDAGPPRTGPAGWFFHLDAKSVAVTRVAFLPDTEGRGWGLAFHLLETTGHATRARLRLFRPPTWARQTDLQGESIIDLPTDGDFVPIDLTPHELARVEVILG